MTSPTAAIAVLLALAGVGLGVTPAHAATGAAIHAQADEPRRFRSAAYDITTDLPDDQARFVADHMDAVAVEYARRFSAYAKRNAEPLRLYVFASRDTYAVFLAERGINSIGSGGMFYRRGSDSGLISYLGNRPMESMLETLRHEGLHQAVYQRIGDTVPTWLNEGMAEWFGYAMRTRRGFAMGLTDPRAVRRLQAAAQAGTLVPLSELLTMTGAEWNTRLNTGAAGAQYDQAWSIVHFLAYADNGRYQPLLDKLIRSFWMGLNEDQANTAAFGDDLEPMDAAWKAHIDSLTPDELYLARDVLRVHQTVLSALDTLDIRPATPQQLDEALAAHAGNLSLGPVRLDAPRDHSLPLEPDAWWRTPPTAARTGRPAVLRFIADGRGDLPPAVEIRGLKNRMNLVWTRSKDGVLSGAIQID
jgi:hypothetical protein